MRIFVLLALVFGFFALCGGTEAQAQERVARWQHYGADHAYPNREAALADAERTMVRAGWSATVAAQMAEIMRTRPCERTELENGDRGDWMRSGANGLWRNVLVDFQPVSMRISAYACYWSETIDGVLYEVWLPDICNNLFGRRSAGPPLEPCVYAITYVDRPVRQSSAILSPGAYREDTCESQYDAIANSAGLASFDRSDLRPITEDAAHPCDWTDVIAHFNVPVTDVRGCIVAGPGVVIYELDPSILDHESNIFVVCETDEYGRVTLSVDVRPWDFHRNAAGIYIAVVHASESAIPASARGATMLWFEWDHTRATELMAQSERWNQVRRASYQGAAH